MPIVCLYSISVVERQYTSLPRLAHFIFNIVQCYKTNKSTWSSFKLAARWLWLNQIDNIFIIIIYYRIELLIFVNYLVLLLWLIIKLNNYLILLRINRHKLWLWPLDGSDWCTQCYVIKLFLHTLCFEIISINSIMFKLKHLHFRSILVFDFKLQMVSLNSTFVFLGCGGVW